MTMGYVESRAGYQSDRAHGDIVVAACLVAILVACVIALPNPYDAEGAIDAYIYQGYSLNFGNLINRYGPLYFSYRSTLIGLLWSASKIFGAGFMHKGLIILYMLMISGGVWMILRRHLGALAAAAFCLIVCLSPWTLRSLATSYMDGPIIALMVLMIGCLYRLSRADFAAPAAAVAAGALLALIGNINAYLVIYGGLIFTGVFAASLSRETAGVLFRAGLVAVAAFVAMTVILWLGWCAVLRLGYGTPVATLLSWTAQSARGGIFDVDMFSVNIARAQGGLLLANLKPDVFRMTSEGQVFVLYPLLAILSGLVYRLWAAPKHMTAFGDVRLTRLLTDWNAGLCAAVLVCAFAYVTSESMGNQMLRWTFYFGCLVPVTFLALAVTAAGMAAIGDEEFVAKAVFAAAGVTLGAHLLFCAAPSLMAVVYPGRWLAKAVALLLVGACLCLVLPIWRWRAPAVALAAVVALGVPLFEASTHAIYQGVYSRQQGRVARDIVDGQRALIAFTETNAPPPGVYPVSNPVLFWHPNSQYSISLQSAYLSDYQSIHRTHEGPALPTLNDTAKSQLKTRRIRDLVLIYHAPEEGDAAQKALREFGLGFQVIGHDEFVGQIRKVTFDYLRIDRWPD